MALAAASAAYLTAEKRVTLFDEGRVRVANTFAPSVGDALDRLGVDVAPGDRVLPDARAPLASKDGRIEIRRAKRVMVVLNGSKRAALVTGSTVDQVLSELHIDWKGALVEPEPSAEIDGGDDIRINQPVEVTVFHDGKSQTVVTNAATAGGLLRQIGIALGPHDRVEPSIVEYPSAGSSIKIVRVNEAIERVLSRIPFRRTSQKTDKIEFGIRELGTTGVDGIRARIYRVTYEDGRPIKKVLLGTEVAKPPVDEVILIGTRRPVFVSHGGSQTGQATWYATPGLSAAHRTLPFGTVVRVTNLANGRHVDVVIRDRGPSGAGRIIDLSNIAFGELAPLGTGVLNVKIEW